MIDVKKIEIKNNMSKSNQIQKRVGVSIKMYFSPTQILFVYKHTALTAIILFRELDNLCISNLQKKLTINNIMLVMYLQIIFVINCTNKREQC